MWCDQGPGVCECDLGTHSVCDCDLDTPSLCLMIRCVSVTGRQEHV